MDDITIKLSTVIWIISTLVLILGAIETIRSFKVKRGLNYKERLKTHDAQICELKEKMEDVDNKLKIVDNIATGIQSLLRSQMVDTYNVYHKKGSIPMWVKNSFDDCFRNYKLLGGNGFMDNIHGVVMEMPLTEDKNVGKSGTPKSGTAKSAGAKQGKSK